MSNYNMTAHPSATRLRELLPAGSQSSNLAEDKDVAVMRFRVSHEKSRNGCVVCKIRHVKCDETFPSCKRCTSTGRKCEGYAAPVAKKKDRSKGPVDMRLAAYPSSVTIYNPSDDIPGTMTERRSLYYLQAQHVTDVPGYFWDVLVLQLSHQDATIRHCIVALSAIYEAQDNRNRPSTATQSQSLWAYNRALRHVASYISSSNQDLKVTLICCIIFVWIEFLQKNMNAGVCHLRSGLRILQHERSCRSIQPKNGLRYDTDDVYGALNRSFSRLSIQVALHGSPTPDLAAASVNTPLFTTDPIPSSFADIFESRIWLDNELQSLWVHFRKLRDAEQVVAGDALSFNPELFDSQTLITVVGARLDRLQKWESATKTIISKLHLPVSDSDTSRVLYLQLYHSWILILLQVVSTHTRFANLDTAFNGYASEFDDMLNFAEAFVLDHYATTTPLLSFDIGIVAPVYFVALKCRVLQRRRKAIEILKQTPDEQGLWRRETVVQYAEWKLQTEEEEQGYTGVEAISPMWRG